LKALGGFRIVYVATKECTFRLAEKAFHRSFDPSRQSSRARLLDYFRLENLYGTEQFDLLDSAKLERLRSLRKEFKGEKFESLLTLEGAWGGRGDLCFVP
jgi:hypothetical protein